MNSRGPFSFRPTLSQYYDLDFISRFMSGRRLEALREMANRGGTENERELAKKALKDCGHDHDGDFSKGNTCGSRRSSGDPGMDMVHEHAEKRQERYDQSLKDKEERIKKNKEAQRARKASGQNDVHTDEFISILDMAESGKSWEHISNLIDKLKDAPFMSQNRMAHAAGIEPGARRRGSRTLFDEIKSAVHKDYYKNKKNKR